MRNKRIGSVMLLVLLCLLVVAGCGTKSANTNGNTNTSTNTGTNTNKEKQPEPASQPEKTEEPTTKTVEHEYGKTEIPVKPQRIASYLLEDNLISLDVPFVYAFDLPGYFIHDQIAAKNIPTSGSFPLNLESLAATNPDLIIISKYAVDDQEGYDKVNMIAPTIAYDPNDWEGSLVKIGDALGLEEKAAAVISKYKERIQEVKQAIVAKIGSDKTAALIRPSAKDLQVFYPGFDSFTKTLYTELGLKVDKSIQQFEEKSSNTWGDDLSMEVLPKLTADYIFSMYGGSISTEEEFEQEWQSVKEFEKSVLWQKLPAVKNKQVGYLSGRHWMMSGAIADNMKLDDVLNTITK